MIYEKSNGHVIDDVLEQRRVTWKGKLVTPIRLQCNIISKNGCR